MGVMAQERVGVDESGKGDYFGPLVVAACFVGPEHVAELEGVRDSKTLTDAKATELAATIRQCCPHEVICIGPTKYNELHARMRNLNHILEWAHAQAVCRVLEQRACSMVVSDQFANPAGLQRQVEAKCPGVTLVSKVRAESDLAVAAASVLARAEFLRRLAALGSQFGMVLPKGAGPPVLVAGRRFLEEHGMSKLGEVAKLHFRTTESLRQP